MKKNKITILISVLFTTITLAQEEKKLYDPNADAVADIKLAVKQAANEGKHVLLQLGGNWCGWCIKFDKKVKSSETLKTTLEANYITYHVNFSQENMNEEAFKALGYPQRFGFPVFVILDEKGNRLHTQNSSYLEEGKGHSEKKILEFFNNWSPKAINPATYKN